MLFWVVCVPGLLRYGYYISLIKIVMSNKDFIELNDCVADLKLKSVESIEFYGHSVWTGNDFEVVSHMVEDQFEIRVHCGLGSFMIASFPFKDDHDKYHGMYEGLYGCEYTPRDFIDFLSAIADVEL